MTPRNILLAICEILILVTCITSCTAYTAISWDSGLSMAIALPNYTNITDVSLANTHVVLTHDDGSFSCWKTTTTGRTPEKCSFPYDIPQGLKFTKVQAFDNWGNLGILENGMLVAWGFGLPQTYAPLPKLGTIRDINCGYDSCLAEKTDGTIIRLKSDFNPRSTSFKVNSPSVGTSVGRDYSFLIVPDRLRPNQGSLECRKNSDNSIITKDIPTDNTFIKVASDPSFTMALKANGGIVFWGWFTNPWWKCFTTFTDIAVGTEHANAVDTDGQLWSWNAKGSYMPEKFNARPKWGNNPGQIPTKYQGHFTKVYAHDVYNIALVNTTNV